MAVQSNNKSKRICPNGHKYYKTSDCPVCPQCEQERTPATDFLALLPAPARRALENNSISSVQDLANYSKKELLSLHGVGPSSIPKLEEALTNKGLSFKK